MSVVVAENVHLDLDVFVATQYSKVVAAVGLITGNRQGAEDAVQDAIVGFLAKPPAHPVTNLAAWFTVVASNRIKDGYRSEAARQRAVAKLAMPVEEMTDQSELLDCDVRNALLQLPIRQRQVCTLHYLMDQSVRTIAEGLGVSEGTVKTQLHRGRKALAARLSKEVHRGLA